MDPIAGTPPLALSREARCVRDLLWRCDLPVVAHVPAVLEALARRGFAESTAGLLVRSMVGPDEDVLVVVPRTARVEIRVSYLVAPEARAARARALARLLAECCGEAEAAT
ncbi:MAG: hypothetical protein HY908_10275 [Myxococcales bacterium]|nr:hypothetical protein [Myxococcales bacterium]